MIKFKGVSVSNYRVFGGLSLETIMFCCHIALSDLAPAFYWDPAPPPARQKTVQRKPLR